MYDDFNQIAKETKCADLIIFERALSALYGYDCKALADELIKRFGSVGGVLCATVRELEAVPSMTHRAAALIVLSSPVLRQALYRSDYALDSERGLAVETCIAYNESPYPFRMCVYTDECGRLVHSEKLCGDDLRVAVGGGARSDARHFGIVEYAPHARSFEPSSMPELNKIIINMKKLGILFIDYIKFDGLVFRSLVREIRGEPPFDIVSARTFRYVCDDDTIKKILSRN